MKVMTFGVWLIQRGAIDGFGGLGRLVKQFAQSDSKVSFGQHLRDLYPDEYLAYRTYTKLVGADYLSLPLNPDKE